MRRTSLLRSGRFMPFSDSRGGSCSSFTFTATNAIAQRQARTLVSQESSPLWKGMSNSRPSLAHRRRPQEFTMFFLPYSTDAASRQENVRKVNLPGGRIYEGEWKDGVKKYE